MYITRYGHSIPVLGEATIRHLVRLYGVLFIKEAVNFIIAQPETALTAPDKRPIHLVGVFFTH